MTVTYSKKTDEKWQKKWEETHLYRFDEQKIESKYYVLEMFSYPSGKTLHIGHWWNYGLCDTYGRLMRMLGCELFHPPGFDAFGLPAENYALQTGMHPARSTEDNIAVMERQFRSMGTTYDWNYEIVTCRSEYYKWTQWLFLQLYRRGLACRKNAPVNFCPGCRTVLANEQAAEGRCERCDTVVVQKNLNQWFFRITAYAEELLAELDALDWPENTKKIQRNWIGKSEGTDLDFTVNGKTLRVFTTRPDTLFGVTFLVLAPEHPMVLEITPEAYRPGVLRYLEKAALRSELDRLSDTGEKTGVFTGACALHPLTKQALPVWVSDYVLGHYGTGAVMAVPAHDERDYTFARTFSLPLLRVLKSPDKENSGLPMCGEGVLLNSERYTGLTSAEAREQISRALCAENLGRPSVRYRLRDWLVSRQRYWGTPIPVIHCADCGAVPVPERDLPVELPLHVKFQPEGDSPLACCKEFVNTVCPCCGKPARRETDTLDTFVCSSWYFLRFYDNRNSHAAFDPERLRQIMPVDMYVGGVEHAAMHLLYARFITKVLRDMGYLTFGEPFPTLVHQGTILDRDGKKMSKRSGAVSPDEYIDRFGSDVLRMHLCFGFSYLDGGPWNDGGIKAVLRFVGRICRIVQRYTELSEPGGGPPEGDMEHIRAGTIAQVSDSIRRFSFNTAIARLMEYTSALTRLQDTQTRNKSYEEEVIRDLLLMLAPLAPHLTEELWEAMGFEYSVHRQRYPNHRESPSGSGNAEVAVQINGRLRDVLTVPAEISEEELRKKALLSPRVREAVGERETKKIVYVKGRVINFVL